MIYEIGSTVICVKDVSLSTLFVGGGGIGIHAGTVFEVVDFIECDYHLVDKNDDSWFIFEVEMNNHFNNYDVVERFDDAMGVL